MASRLFNVIGEIASRVIVRLFVDIGIVDASTFLHIAAQYGHAEVVRLLLKRKVNVNKEESQYGFTPLHMAAQNGRTEVVILLLEHEANVNKESEYGFTSLHIAAQYGHIDVVELLLRHEADVNARDCDDCTPLHIAAQYGHIDVMELLLPLKQSLQGRLGELSNGPIKSSCIPPTYVEGVTAENNKLCSPNMR